MMTSTQILAIGAPWIVAIVGFVAYLVWPKNPNPTAASTGPAALTLDEAPSAVDHGLTVISARQPSDQFDASASPRQRVPERT